MNAYLKSHSLALLTIALTLALVFLPDIAHAAGASGNSSGGAEFGELYTYIKGLCQGRAGQMIAVLSLFVGMVIGIARQSLMLGLIGFGIALVLTYGPGVIEGVFTFAIPM